MWRFPVWKRTVVMSAGSITHFLLGLVAIWVLAIIAACRTRPTQRPSRDSPQPARIAVADLRDDRETADRVRRPATRPARPRPRACSPAT